MQQADFKRKYRGSGATYIQNSDGWRRKVQLATRGVPLPHLFAAGGLCACLIAFVAAPNKTEANNRQKIDDIAIPALEGIEDLPELAHATLSEELLELEATLEPPTATQIEVKPGDNLSLIFQRAGLSDKDVYKILDSSTKAKQLKQLYPGHVFEFIIEDKQLQQLNYIASKVSTFSFHSTGDGFSFHETSRTPETHLTMRSAEIEHSLFAAGKEAGMDDKLVMELAGIFGWDVDFALDIREGDSFKVLYEEQFLDGQKIGNGAILAAEFINRGSSFQAVRYEDHNGNVQYYTPDGKTMRKEFLRTPIDFARISSHFNLRRKHPVLNRIRAHKGTDYAASRGTPIKAAGDGKVIFAGRKGGYGNVVILQHGQTYKTLYAHISKFRGGIRRGKRVKQGQVIAYVGSTGLATGPHLHYEFYVNGAVRNPVTVRLPKAKSIPKKELARFAKQTQMLLAELDSGTGGENLAKSNSQPTNKL
ncbi:MAG: peptidoglycan DD-metalloendopeptidase family protein [Cellvibrionaceae bacterium]|nr:peptidoglycan DD-metalloendopeptidase family protein [Cellvibrionaceae bacterium]